MQLFCYLFCITGVLLYFILHWIISKCCCIVQSREMDSDRIDLLLELVPQAVMIRFFRRKKTAISSQVDEVFTFLNQLKDNEVISENLYQARKKNPIYSITFSSYSWNNGMGWVDLLIWIHTLTINVSTVWGDVNVWSVFINVHYWYQLKETEKTIRAVL